MSYRVEFKVPGGDRWESSYGTYSTEAEARKKMAGAKQSLRDEGNPVGKWRVREGRGATPGLRINWGQWILIGLSVAMLVEMKKRDVSVS